ncbi:adenine deaminase [Bacillus sp. ISL-40]|uniref:adenine deaminase n=1 Tax=unclassified Bacillus (in: firmicutes) TaxID=185979 RepID=UPI001BE8B5F4|nr:MULTISPECIES: adenine deaminase [unclassified Bacillus (in: firmicutes)]MBT2697408.1 adenine deaminase [Bacillus sp. ISL-40]MBT2723908.1 adenine deaminase [Bacillus sp. ISL-46]MBT2741776.1 adenine deaminase [Bacillus sp. ISL-77]
MEANQLKRRISVASKREPADTVIKNGKIIDVFNGEIIEGDLAIVDGYFAGIGDYEGNRVIDANSRYISPAFIDGHVHIESSMVTPNEFAKVLLPHGVTTIIADPHEIANVLGAEGIQYMLDSSENLPFDFFFMLPSCVPATEFENSGATLNAKDLQPFYQQPRVLGLAEVMNFPAVLKAEDDMLEKILTAKQSGKKIDGHAAGLSANDLNVYLAAGIRTDHESTTAIEAKERLRRGMYLMIREGTVAKDLQQLIPIVNERNARRCLFVTDDKHLDDLIHDGSIDHNVRLAIASGISSITAIQMATINAAECFGLEAKGAIAPGYKADFFLFDDLENITITTVYKDGIAVVENGRLIIESQDHSLVETDRLKNTVRFHELTENHFQIPLKTNKANIIEIIPNSLVTRHIIEKVNASDSGIFQPSIIKDQLKLAVIERHHMKNEIGLGIVKGLGLKSGAIATTIAHDSHNLIIAGTTDLDMVVASKAIKDIQGGLVVVNQGEVIASLRLSIAGLMSDRPYQEVYSSLNEINLALKKLGAHDHFNPFLTISFLSLPVIPELKLTDKGLFQISKFEHIDLDA